MGGKEGAVMKTLLFASAILSSPVFAVTYYLSSASGDDSRSAALAQNSATPWRSLSKIQGLSLGAGDMVLLERGGTYPGTMALGQGSTVAGAVGNPVTIGAYGTGAVPQITGTQSLSGAWALYQGNIWYTPVIGAVEQLFLDGNTLTLARFPNQGTVPITSVISANVFRCAALIGKNLQGATVFARTEHWTWNMNPVSAFDPATGQITFSGTPIYPVLATWGAWLNNHLSLLDAPGEWFFDATAGRLYVWLPGNGNPNGRSIEASVPGHGIALTNVRQAVIQDLWLRGHGGDGINGSGSDVVMRRLKIENCMGSGMRINGARLAVEQSEITGPNVYGMVVSGDGNRLEGNTVKRVAEMARLTRTGVGGECCSGRGLNVSGNDVIVRNNILDSIGYVGIGFSGQRNLIDHNLVRHYCMTTDDGAAIYTWNSDFALPGPAGTIIRNNLVLDAIGAPDGIPDRSTFALGIYMDDRSHHVVIEGNTVSGTDIGIFLHNTRDDTVRNNLSYANHLGQLITQRDNIVGANDMYGSVVYNNTLYSVFNNGPPFLERLYQTNASPLLASRTGDLECSETPFGVRCDRNGLLVWERAVSILPSDTAGRSIYSYSFPGNTQGWGAWPMPPVAMAYDAAQHGGSLRVDYGGDTANRAPLLYAPRNIPVQIGQRYLLKFSGRASSAFDLNIIPRQSHSTYSNLAPTQTFRLGTVWADYLFPFEITSADTSCRLDFNWSRNAAQFWIDDVSFYPMPPGDTSAGPFSVLYYDAGTSALSVNPSPGNSWLDVQGVTRNGAVTLQSLEAFVAIRDQNRLGTPVRKLSASHAFRNLNRYPVLLFPGSEHQWRDARGRVQSPPRIKR